MLRLLVAALAFAGAVAALDLFYPYEYRGGFLVMHDRGISADTARILHVAIPVAALTLVVTGAWNVKKALWR